jgi:hypothetical protein
MFKPEQISSSSPWASTKRLIWLFFKQWPCLSLYIYVCMKTSSMWDCNILKFRPKYSLCFLTQQISHNILNEKYFPVCNPQVTWKKWLHIAKVQNQTVRVTTWYVRFLSG